VKKAQKILWQIGIIFGISIAGDIIAAALPIPFPGSVVGMVLLFLLLVTRLLKPKYIDETADFLRDNMSFLFVPSSVGIMQYFSTLKPVWFPFVFICITTTVITFAAASSAVRVTVWIQQKAGGVRG